MSFPRVSGVLLHPTCFPSRFGVGDLGSAAYEFIDFLADSRQSLWQILPLGTPGYGNSPYLAYSAMAGNPLLISPDLLIEQDLLHVEDCQGLPDFPADRTEFDAVLATKMPLLLMAFERFRDQATDSDRQDFEQFCQTRADWLDDYALFMAIRENRGNQCWNDWDPELRQRDPGAIADWRDKLHFQIEFHQFLQFVFFRQWSALKSYANERGIQIIGDIPIYVAHDSADVWACPQNFRLNPETGNPELMAGVPPDYFSATGQLWGNPVYDWDYLQKTGFDWWIRRFKTLLDYVDIVRIDHFRGLRAYWAVPEGETTAMNGEWIQAPGDELFETIRAHLGDLPVVAEDLGIITPDVEELRDRFDFPGMKILLFAFDSGPDNPYLPFNYEGRNWMVYSGTHDNNTTVGWFNERSDEAKTHVANYLGQMSSEGIHWDLIRLASSSTANQAIFPLQDLLGLGSEARMNFPGVAEGNWQWRYRSEMLQREVSDRFRLVTELYGRVPR